MTTYDSVLLTILAGLMSLFFLLGIVGAILTIRVIASIKRVVVRAESVVDSVEAAADVLKDASGKLTLFKVLKNIFDMVQHKNDK